MNKSASVLPVDRIQEAITDFGYALRFEDLSEQDCHAAKIRLIDTIGGLIGAFDCEPCRMTREIAKAVPSEAGATIFGTDIKVTPEMAAFTNATAARFLETNDVYFPLSYTGCHPSDMIMPILAVAEQVGASGRDIITAIVLAYEIYSRVSDKTKAPGFDQTNFVCMGTAVAAAKIMGLSRTQMHHALSMAVVPNNPLYQTRRGHLTMWKAVAAGQAGRNGIFAATLASVGIEGAHMPFEGECGWCDFVGRNRFILDEFGGRDGAAFRIHDSKIKIRAACAQTISPSLAAEKISPSCKGRIGDIENIRVETFASAKAISGTGEQYWNPQDRETADHSIPYVVSATLIDGTIGPRQFDDAHLWNPELRALIQRVDVGVRDEFTRAYDARPSTQCTQVIVKMRDGTELVGESGGDKGDINNPMTDTELERKFGTVVGDTYAPERQRRILDKLWRLEDIANAAEIAPLFMLD